MFLVFAVSSNSFADPLDNWHWRNPLPQGNDLRGITHGNNMFVAVGSYGTILTSPDGTNWTTQTSGTEKSLSSVTYGNNLYVAVGEGTILTSADGKSWSVGLSRTDVDLYSVAYGNNTYVAVGGIGGYGTIMTSPDGVTWTSLSSGISTFYGIAFGNGIFVAVSTNYSWCSTDGSIWTTGSFRGGWAGGGITFGNNIFVAVGINGSIQTTNDGITWTAQTAPGITYSTFTGVTYGNNIFVAVCYDGDTITSSDGITWTERILPSDSIQLRKVAWGGNIAVAVGDYGTIITSPDGKTWTELSSGTSVWLTNVSYGNNTFVAVGSTPSGSTILSSTDGVSWTSRSPSTSSRLEGVAYGNNIFVAVGAGKIMTSYDGITWTWRVNSNSYLLQVTFVNNIFIAVGLHGSIITSPDGITWTQRSSGTGAILNAIAYGNNIFVVVGVSGTILTSSDAITWSESYQGREEVLSGVAYGNNMFVVVQRYVNTMYTSSDGIIWETKPFKTCEKIIYANNSFVAIGQFNGGILSSNDGITWVPGDTRTSKALFGIVFGGHTFVAVGQDGTIIQSNQLFPPPTSQYTNVFGSVYDKKGNKIPGASIHIGPYSTTTDGAGHYNFIYIPAGTYNSTVSMSNFSTIKQVITLTSASSIIRDFRLISAVASDIEIIDVSSKYNGFLYYIAGTDFFVTYNANVSWGSHQPGIIRFITARGNYDVPVIGTTAYKTFNIATDFDPCTTLRVVAIAADGKMSAEKSADFTVMSPVIAGLAFNAIDIGDGYYYKQKLELNLLGEGIGAGSIPSDIPLFGGKEFKLNIVPSVDVMVNSSGRTEIGLEIGLNGSSQNKTNTSVAGMELSLAPKVQLEGDYVYPGCYYQWSGLVGFAGGAKVSKSWPFVVMAGPIPIPMYAKASLQVDANALLGVTSLDPLALEGQPFSINPYARGSLGAGVDETLAVEGWLGGGADFLLQYPQLPHMKDATIALNGGVTVYALLWKWENEALRWDWNLTGGGAKTVARAARSSLPTAYLVSRDYLTTTSTFGKQNSKMTLKSVALSENQIYTVSTIPLQNSIFPYSQPRLSSAGANMSLTWLTDNANRSAVNRTQAVFSAYSGATWSTPQSIADDGTADFSPVALTFSDGTVIAAWEDEKIALPDTATFNDMVQNLEISSAVYDPSTKTWKPYQFLTDNAYIDRSPKLSGKAKDNVMLVWISNDANDIRGGNATTNKIWYATFNGKVWSTPQLAAQVPFGIVKYSLAYNGNHARLAMSLDTDGDSSTVAGHELYLLSYDNNTWGALTRLADDTAAPVADDNPQVAIDPDGDFVLTWLRGNEISSVVNFDMAGRSVIRADRDYSSNLADFKLISAPDGKMAIIWAEPSTNSSDIFTAVYDPIYDLWGGPKQLTFDVETEKNITAAFLGSETLIAAYNRTLMGQATPTTTDLYMLTHTMGNDLALQGGSLVATPPNPAPGNSVTFTVTAQNLGDTAQESIPVVFYQGDPANGGIKISEATIAGPFKPGDTKKVSITWTIPQAAVPLTIYAVIDPTANLDPINRGNNVTTMTLTMADLVVTNMSWTKLTDKLISVTTRVTNSGTIPSQTNTIKFRRDSLNGTTLNSQILPALAMEEARDFNFIWDVTGLTNQQYIVFAVADEENVVSEFDETNNTESVTIPVNLTNVTATLNVQTTGTGVGSVASTPSGVACNVNCSGQFSWGTAVTLHATPAPYSLFTGWAAPFGGTDDFTISMNGANSITATFDYNAAHKARIYATTPVYYPTLHDAFVNASSGGLIQAWAQPFTENITVTKSLKFKGGYDDGYVSNGGFSVLHGTLTIKSGRLTVEKLVLH